MGLSAPRNTLSHQLARPLCARADMGWVPVPMTAARISDLLKEYSTKGRGHPETEAQRFYLLQHAMAEIRNRKKADEPLGEFEWVVETYHSECSPVAIRMFAYLVLICTREFRHGGSGANAQLGKKFGPEVKEFREYISGDSSDVAVQKFLKNPPNMPLGRYCAALEWIFLNASFSSAFGGKKWAYITSVLRKYVIGEFSAEMMLDTAFTLAHNGGPMFNKGYCWHYPDSEFIPILDVQASGQMPQLFADHLNGSHWLPDVNSGVMEIYQKVAPVIGTAFDGYVDWVAVKKAATAGKKGGHDYTSWIQKQIQKYGPSPTAAATVEKPPLGKPPVWVKPKPFSQDEDGLPGEKLPIDVWNKVTLEEKARE